MSVKKINGFALYGMLKNGLSLLYQNVERINELNVFPVADGDTGTNMSKTLENGLRHAVETPHAGYFLCGLSEGMLYGARGNSGVILSQFFRGMYEETARKDMLGPGEVRNALIAGYKSAYKAVSRPVEGTILTVSRLGIENIRSQISRSTTIDALLSMYVAEMKRVLSSTPEILPVLKESGVVDSGAVGFICILEGMEKYLYGETVKARENAPQNLSAPSKSFDRFNENDEFTEGYCLEFILQLMQNGHFNPHFEIQKFTNDLQLFGSSIVTAKEGSRVKVHIHTLHPARTLSLCEEYGVFLDFKLDNLQWQKQEVLANKERKNRKPFAKAAFVNGDGMRRVYENLGCAVFSAAESLSDPSAEEFCNAVNSLNAEKIVLLPNNKNAVMAAEQAKKLCDTQEREIIIIPTENSVEGYFALAMDIPDSPDTDRRIAGMQQYKDGLTVVMQTVATKDCAFADGACKKGDCITLLDGKLFHAADDCVSCIVETLEKCGDTEDKDSLALFVGKDMPEEQTERLTREIRSRFPLMEIETISGGQTLYGYMLGLV